MVKAHKKKTATFAELDFAGQTKAINAEMLNIEAAIKANIKRAIKEERENPKDKRIAALKKVIERLEEFTA